MKESTTIPEADVDSTPRSRSSRGPAAGAHLAVILIYAGGAFALFHKAWAAPGRRLVGACCDSAAYVDTFRITGNAVLHGQSPFFSTYMHAPVGFNVMWQPDVMPLVGLVSTPLEGLFGPMVTYNLVVTLALALSGWACFVCLRRWVGGTAGPFVGGAFWGFSPMMTAHSLGHPQYTNAMLLAFAILVLTEILVRQGRPWWVSGPTLGALAAAQLLVGEEMLAFLAITCVVLLVTLVIRYRDRVRMSARHAGASLAAAAATFGLLAAWPAGEQFLGPEQIHGAIRNTSLFSTNLAATIIPNPATTEFSTSWTVRDAHQWFASPGLSETTAYLGIPLLVVLGLVVLARRRDPVVQVTTACVVVLTLLSLGTVLRIGAHSYNVWLPWRLLHALPLLNSALPTSLSIFVDLGVAVVIAEAVESVIEWGSARRRLLGLGALALALAPLTPTFHYPYYEPDIPSFFTSQAVTAIPAGATVLVAPIPRGGLFVVDTMIWQAVSGLRFRMVGGVVFVPDAHGHKTAGGSATSLTAALDLYARSPGPVTVPLTNALIAAGRRDLRLWAVSVVILGPTRHRSDVLALLDRVVGHQPRLVGGVYLWTDLALSGGRPGP